MNAAASIQSGPGQQGALSAAKPKAAKTKAPAAEARRVLEGMHFMSGDHACAEGALAAGLRFFAGYPITPSTEIAERLAVRMPGIGGVFAQMEDELGSMAAIIGASVAGARSMTATSGPGFSLMMENIGLAVMMEAPCVIVNVQRGSVSTGLPTLVGQADVMQARFGSHGDYAIVAYAPASPQECFDLTVKAFNTADQYRVPVFVMADEVVGHMTERVVIPPAGQIPFVGRKPPSAPARAADAPGRDGSPSRPGAVASARRPFLPFASEGDDLVPPMAHAGEGYRVHFTGLTHDERGYPSMNAEAHDRLIRRLVDKVERNADRIIECEACDVEDAEVIVVSYGCMARSARQAVTLARREGRRVGLLRLITLWPFPENVLRRLAAQSPGRSFIVAELNLGQMAREVERCVRRPVIRVNHAGGKILQPDAVLDAIVALGGQS